MAESKSQMTDKMEHFDTQSQAIKDNPWDVKSLDAFCIYQCPECDYQHEEMKSFRDHAIYEHELV